MNGKCSCCGMEVTQGNATCPQCGLWLQWEEKAESRPATCPGCGGKLEAGQKFCPECGTAVGGRKAGASPGRAAGCATDTRKYDEAVRMGQQEKGQTPRASAGRNNARATPEGRRATARSATRL